MGASVMGMLPSLTTKRSIHVSFGSPVVRWTYSRMPNADEGTTMATMTTITMPTPSNTPKSRIIGTFEMRSATNAATPVNVAAIIGGARLASVSPIGCTSCSLITSSSIRLCTWIAKSMPRPSRIGSPAMVTSERSMPSHPSREKAHVTPIITVSSGSRRQRTLKMNPRISAMTTIAARPRRTMPPFR